MSMTDIETLIKTFEGLSLKVYADPIGILTGGYGHVSSNMKLGQPISINQAEEWLEDDINAAQILISKYISVDLNENQLIALTSLVFNLGAAPLLGTLGKLLNHEDYAGAANEFLRWVHAGGKILPGLVKRRAAEQKIFLTPIGD